MSLIPQCKALLEQADQNPEALLYLLSGAIDSLNRLGEEDLGSIVKESWQSQYQPRVWS
jgi:hypothetical protein